MLVTILWVAMTGVPRLQNIGKMSHRYELEEVNMNRLGFNSPSLHVIEVTWGLSQSISLARLMERKENNSSERAFGWWVACAQAGGERYA